MLQLVAASRDAAVPIEDPVARMDRIERNLHDGTQARLIAVATLLDLAMSRLAACTPQHELEEARALLAVAHGHARDCVTDIRVLLRGGRPAALAKGLESALADLAAVSAVPVELHLDLPCQLPAQAQEVLYFSAAELLANVAKHSGAWRATVEVVARKGTVQLRVEDDGVGGANRDDPGGGLAGLGLRVAAAGGCLQLDSPPGGPTAIVVVLPGPG